MAIFQQPLWGYEITYPDDWTHLTIKDTEGFAPTPEMLTPGFNGENAGHLLLRAEWNCARQPIEPLWKEHIGKVAGFIGAKQVQSARWQIAGGVGFEAEILLPKKDTRRLWTGILEHNHTVLHLMVSHPKEERSWFEPVASHIITSLRFLDTISGLELTTFDLPLPPKYTQVDPARVIDDIQNPQEWLAFEGKDNMGALQAFYLRELPNFSWEISEYVPFPSPSTLGFARLKLRKGDQKIFLGLLPFTEKKEPSINLARIVVKRLLE